MYACYILFYIAGFGLLNTIQSNQINTFFFICFICYSIKADYCVILDFCGKITMFCVRFISETFEFLLLLPLSCIAK